MDLEVNFEGEPILVVPLAFVPSAPNSLVHASYEWVTYPVAVNIAVGFLLFCLQNHNPTISQSRDAGLSSMNLCSWKTSEKQ